MTLNLLLDLDDTLIDTNLDSFLPAYFKKLAGFMSNRVPPQQFIQALMSSTQVMYDSERVDRSLEQVFSDHFYPALGFEQDELADALNQFYDEVFPTLSPLTGQRPEAIEFVDWAFSKGWKVSIATDPLFPRKAILHRLRWAGLAPEKYPFSLVSDFHHFHFAKKSIAFYPEFLARMEWQDEPVLMVGDSLERDIMPSQQAGLPVFWLKTKERTSQNDLPQGGFSDLRNFLETADPSSFKVSYVSPAAAIQFLKATPAAIHALMQTNPGESWKKHPAKDEWSLLEILCHLRDVDVEVNLPRVEAILYEENAFITGQPTDQWAQERNYVEQDAVSSFDMFAVARNKLVEVLTGISTTDWGRRARHSFLGPTTLRELVEFMVDHDRLHIRQASAALK